MQDEFVRDVLLFLRKGRERDPLLLDVPSDSGRAKKWGLPGIHREEQGGAMSKRQWRKEVSEKACDVCTKRKSVRCPNSDKCYATDDKPHFEPKPYEPAINFVDIFRMFRKGGNR